MKSKGLKVKYKNRTCGFRRSLLFALHPSLFTLFLLLPAAAHAERYRVDLILFADKTGVGDESPQPAKVPELARALEPTDAVKLRAAGIEMLPDNDFGLLNEWKKLSNSQRQQPLLRLAWLQKDPPAERGVSLRLRAGAALDYAGSPPSTPDAARPTLRTEIYTVDGTVALLMGRFLHLDADLAYTQAGNAGEFGSYRLKERRRMRRNELHHLDSPRLGLLVRVQKAEK